MSYISLGSDATIGGFGGVFDLKKLGYKVIHYDILIIKLFDII
jgi:hypothetical protein